MTGKDSQSVLRGAGKSKGQKMEGERYTFYWENIINYYRLLSGIYEK